MDQVQAFCLRMLGPGGAAEAAEQAARKAADGDDRVTLLAAAASECRVRDQAAGEADSPSAEPVRTSDPGSGGPDRGAEPATSDPAGPTEPQAEDDPRGEDLGPADPAALADAVADELARATSRLPERQREALALRELLGLSYPEISDVAGVDLAAVAPLVARARLRLRAALRGEGLPAPECPERDRALRTIALRQDGEEVSGADDDWLVDHLGHCSGCGYAHSAMLEASACYRAWRLPDTAVAATGP